MLQTRVPPPVVADAYFNAPSTYLVNKALLAQVCDGTEK
jgi:hypothetical protein